MEQFCAFITNTKKQTSCDLIRKDDSSVLSNGNPPPDRKDFCTIYDCMEATLSFLLILCCLGFKSATET